MADSNGRVPEHGHLRAVAANGRRPAGGATRVVRRSSPRSTRWCSVARRPQPPSVAAGRRRGRGDLDAGDVPARPGSLRGGGCRQRHAAAHGARRPLPETDKLAWASGPGTTTGQSIRNANFDAGLRPYFHYSLWNHNQPDNPPASPGGPPVVNSSSGLCCSDSGKDVLVSLGQWANSVGTTRDQSRHVHPRARSRARFRPRRRRLHQLQAELPVDHELRLPDDRHPGRVPACADGRPERRRRRRRPGPPADGPVSHEAPRPRRGRARRGGRDRRRARHLRLGRGRQPALAAERR